MFDHSEWTKRFYTFVNHNGTQRRPATILYRYGVEVRRWDRLATKTDIAAAVREIEAKERKAVRA